MICFLLNLTFSLLCTDSWSAVLFSVPVHQLPHVESLSREGEPQYLVYVFLVWYFVMVWRGYPAQYEKAVSVFWGTGLLF